MTDQHFSHSARFNSLGVFLTALILPVVLSCGGEEGGGATEPETWGVTAVTFSQGDLELLVRAKTELTVLVEGPGGSTLSGVPVSYSSSAPQVADVDSQGWVTAMGAGSATITATAEGRSGSVQVTVTVLDQFVSISAGDHHTCGISDSGAAWCWGRTNEGQLGLTGPMEGEDYPHPVDTGLTFQSISAGSNQSCGLTNLGKAYCWGSIVWGVLTEMTYETWNVPQAVPGDLTFQSFRTSGVHMCGLTADGTAYCWGQNAFNELGTSADTPYDTFGAVRGDLRFSIISPNSRHTCGIALDGVTHCWGDDEFGERGGGAPFLGVVEGSHLFQELAPTVDMASCGIEMDGDAYCWGRNEIGNLGGGPSENRMVPTLVPGGLQFRSLSIGWTHGCGVTVADLAYCWGQNTLGQIGDGTLTDRTSPALVSGGYAFTQVTAGSSHTCGLTTSGSVYCWGDNGEGQLGAGSELQGSNTPVLIHGSR